MNQYINQLFKTALSEFQRDNFLKSRELLEIILKTQPKSFEVNHLIGVIYGLNKEHIKAKYFLENALKANSKDIWTYFNLANSHKELGEDTEALKRYSKAIQLKPDFVEALTNKSNILCKLKKFEEALENAEKAIQLKPNLAEPWSSKGFILYGMRRYEEAISSSERAIQLKPDLAESFFNLGNIFNFQKLFNLALRNYETAYLFEPDYKYLIGAVQKNKMLMCDWANYDGQRLLIAQKIINNIRVSDPFSALAIIDDPSIHRICCEIFLKDSFPSNKTLGPISKSSRKNKIRIGYFSADFYNHATAYLMAEFFELHDKSQFEIVAFSFGFIQEDEMRTRLKNAFDIFIDVSDQSDESVAKLSRELKIDIAVDLKGLTANSRTGIFSYRAAPIQVNYLGYPGSMAADYMDYIIADYNLIPVKSQKFYSEKIIYLPDSYQVNDRKRIISKKKFTKSELGLPEDGFIFCCFNNNYKITPHTFDSWMRILNTVERSVLWLLQGNEWAVDNLKKEAQKRGVDENRLVFAKIFPLDEHLVRHSQADLFLDTFPCNAHTTASDALWAGLPVLTRMGESFASRVATSLLNAIALPELITSSQEHYEALAIELASHPTKLNAIKMKLGRNRLTTPLFDTPNFTKHLENAYIKIYERHHAAQLPDHIYIDN